MDQGKDLIRLALFGRPIKASLSPTIQRMFADQFGLNISFERIETGADGFPQALAAFRLAGGVGCNVTLPLKRDAWRLAAESLSEVIQAQAANTLVYQPSSGWFAHNTDGAGLIADLSVNHGIDLVDQRILLLGAGGAVAGIMGSLLAGSPSELVLVNRNLDRARRLSEQFGAHGKISVTGWTDLPLQDSFNLVINATSLGHHGEAPPLPPSVFAPDGVCYDLNYFKASLPLKNLCADFGQRYIDGLGKMVEQAAKSFYIWTGNQPKSDVVIGQCRSGDPVDNG
jgi:shikimate dehydrogenase